MIATEYRVSYGVNKRSKKKAMFHNTENTLKNTELLHFKCKMDKHILSYSIINHL